jgi:Domain of unknown function (DUF3291)
LSESGAVRERVTGVDVRGPDPLQSSSIDCRPRPDHSAEVKLLVASWRNSRSAAAATAAPKETLVPRFHLAQVNIGRLRAPLDDPMMEGFRSQLDPINALADRSPGFVWRLQTEDGNATSIRPFEDERMAINMSVWESLDALQQFVYRSAHVGPLRDRKQWFEPLDGPILALWWIPIGHIPTVAAAKERLEHLAEHGPSPHAFTFRTPFPAPDQEVGGVSALDLEFCEWAT